MTLECTLVRSPTAPMPADPEELTIEVPPGASGAQLEALIKAVRNTGQLSVAGRYLADLTVGVPPLVSGAVIVDGFVPPAETSTMLPLMLLTHTGPAAGSVFRIPRGQHHIGRGTAGISLPDPGMSREHALLDVSGERLEVTSVAAANPIDVDGRPVRRALVTSRSSLRCGHTTFSLAPDNECFPAVAADAGRSVQEPIEVPCAKNHGSRATIALAAGLPLIAGIGLAAATGMWMYLGFSAISALGLVFPLLLGGKGRQEYRRALDHAVREDIARRHRCSPSAAELLVAGQSRPAAAGPGARGLASGGNLGTPSPDTNAGGVQAEPRVWLRLGTAQSSANIRLVPGDRHFSPPPVGSCPVSLDPGHRRVAIQGHGKHVAALLRFIVMQLASFPNSASAPIVLLGAVEDLPLSARFLPQVTLAADADAAVAAVNTLRHGRQGTLIVMESPTGQENEALSRAIQASHQAQWQVLHCHSGASVPLDAITIEPSGVAASFESAGERFDFVPDLVPAEVFDRFCRTVAARLSEQAPRTHGVLPDRSSLAALLPCGQRRILSRWRTASGLESLTAVLGEGRAGPVTFDLKMDGPHLLIAGTTGSGKSELLKTFVASIALSVPPEHAAFLFFDFKGGSGLGPLTALPHCVGILTDLSRQHLDRALESLRGEIRHREKLFADWGATDLAEYQRMKGAKDCRLPHLILVIDEFRILVDEAPAALHELMRVATIGRSLGIHLVMATQRPQGALTADIRANVTSSIALRVQSEMESVDIINSKAAASIGVDVPGRAFLATASKEPEEFQAASLDAPQSGGVSPMADHLSPGSGAAPDRVVRSVAQALGEPFDSRDLVGKDVDGSGRSTSQALTGAGSLVSNINAAWRHLGTPSPRSPIAAPLPHSIPWTAELSTEGGPEVMHESDRASWRVGPVALVDKPAQQRVECLTWMPADHGHLALIGNASSGMQDSFRAITALVATRAPQPHLYILDASRLLGQLESQQGIAAFAGVDQVGFAARILSRLAAEMERRRALGGLEGRCRPLVLIVAGWCSWSTAFRGGPHEWAEGILHDIARDGSPVGITLLISGERELVSSRLFAAIPNRAYFPLGTTDESRFHWPRLPEVEPVRGRAAVMGNVVEGQTASAQFREAPTAGLWPFGDLAPAEPPFRLRPLPHLLTREDFLNRKAALGSSKKEPRTAIRSVGADEKVPEPLWIGVAGDEAQPAALPLRDNGVSLVLGGPSSGKSTILGSLVRLNPGTLWLFPPDAASAGTFWASTASEATAGNLDPGSVLLVDDADSLDAQGRQALNALDGQVAGIILTATFGPALHQLPLARQVQAAGMGLVLSPSKPHDGELLGVRLQPDTARRPGRGFIVDRGVITPCQAVLSSGLPARG